MILIQRFGCDLNLNIHFHMLFLDGVYIEDKYGASRFRRVKAPTSDELSRLTHTIAHRVGRYLERRGLLERDAGSIHKTVINDPKRQGTLRVENTLVQWYDPCQRNYLQFIELDLKIS